MINAVEAVQRVSPHPRRRVLERVAARRGRDIGVVAGARELVYYGLRDGRIRRLAPPSPAA
jgi:hypothetical protein